MIKIDKFSKLWWIFAIGGTSVIFLDPYSRDTVGLNIGELFVLFCLNIISIKVREKELKEPGEKKVRKVLIRKLGNLSYILPVLFFLMKLAAGIIIFLFPYPELKSGVHEIGWGKPDIMLVVCLIVEMIFNVLLLISFMYKGKILKEMVNENKYINMNKGKYKKINIVCITTLTISIVIGFFNPYEHYITFIYNLSYPFVMFIYFINLKVARNALQGTIFNWNEEYIKDYCKSLEGKKTKLFMIGSLCFMKIMILIIQFNLYSIKLVLNSEFLMFILATVAEMAVVITFSIRIWKESGQGDETGLCH